MPPGLDLSRLTPWFAKNIPQASPPLDATIVSGGRSNLTFVIEDSAGHKWVLRRPPLGHLLPSAHDMAREHRILAALWPTGLPVPRPVALCEDEGILGRPFYVMKFVDGMVIRGRDDYGPLAPASRAATAKDLVLQLARLHELEPNEIGLGNLGRRENYIARQLKRWRQQIQDIHTSSADELRRAHATLSRTIPEQMGVSIVHGDYRLDNVIVGEEGKIAAILDWELCTLGDPRADVGMLMTYWATSDTPIARMTVPIDAEGFPTREEIRAMYESAGGSTTNMNYFVVFAHWRLGAILEGVYARYEAGAYGDEEGDHRNLPEIMDYLARAIRRMIDEL